MKFALACANLTLKFVIFAVSATNKPTISDCKNHKFAPCCNIVINIYYYVEIKSHAIILVQINLFKSIFSDMHILNLIDISAVSDLFFIHL